MKKLSEWTNADVVKRVFLTGMTLTLMSLACVSFSAEAAAGVDAAKKVIRVGSAWADITPSNRIEVVGQYTHRWGEYTHDPLSVNAVMFEQDGKRVAMVSCDLGSVPPAFVKEMKERCEKEVGIPASSVLINATHTHVAPGVQGSEADVQFTTKLRQSIVDVVRQAAADLEDVDLYAGKGFVEQMGFNRRGLYAEGTKCDMYYGDWKPGFVGLEGKRDGEVGVIFARNSKGDLKVVIPNFSTHPTCLESDEFYSADIVGAVRIFIRRNLGDKVGVVWLTGAAGNTSPEILVNNKDNYQPWKHEEGFTRSGQYLGGEIVKTIAATIYPMKNPVLKFEHTVVNIPMRPWPKDFNLDEVRPSMKASFQKQMQNWPTIMKEQSPVAVPINVLRLGDAVICTNPSELYAEFGLDIKKKSPASVTLISELTDGAVGYIPTAVAIKHGGYSAVAGLGAKLDNNAGKIIADTTGKLLNRVFPKQ